MTKPSVAPVVVVHAVGEWLTFEGALFRKLAAALAAAIERGDLLAGRCLPSERTLAPLLSVSRGTVVAAYGELQTLGLVERRRGSGTWVTGGAVSSIVELRDVAAAVRSRRLTARSMPAGDATIDLGVSILLDLDGVADDMFHLDRADLAQASRGHGYQPLGIAALRRRLAELHTADGLPTSPDQIAVTNGAQHAISLIGRLLVRPGDEVIVESPTYPGAIDAFSRVGAVLSTVGSDGGGARVDLLARSAKLVYVMPACHNPTGAVMAHGRRRALAAFADDTDTWVVEDNSLAHLVFDGAARPAVAAYGTGDRVLTVGSLSKLVWGGLRVGWIRGPGPVISRIGRLRAADDFGNSTPSQVIALRALHDAGPLAEHRRETFERRSELTMELIDRHLPGWDYTRPAGGLSLWVRLPTGTADTFAAVAARHGVAFLPGGAASVDDSHPDRLRLSFVAAPAHLEEGVRRLSRAWDDYTADVPTAGPVVAIG